MIPKINPNSRFEATGKNAKWHHACAPHNVVRWTLFLEKITRVEVALYLIQLVELWQKHRDELDANRPDNHHHQHTVQGRSSVEDEVKWALDKMMKAGVLREI